MPRPVLSPPGEIVRRHDPDRFFAALFAPADRREALFTLYAFNHELARAREVVREPMAALIRLQWWREVVEGARRRHEVAGPVGEALDQGRLHAGDLLAMIDGREAETETVETLEDWKAYVRATAGGVAVAAGRVLGGSGAMLAALRDLGAAYGVAGVLRSVPALAQQGRCMLPSDVLARHGCTAGTLASKPDEPGATAVREQLAAIGRLWMQAGWNLTRERRLMAAWLPAVAVSRELRHGAPAGVVPRGNKVAMAGWAARSWATPWRSVG